MKKSKKVNRIAAGLALMLAFTAAGYTDGGETAVAPSAVFLFEAEDGVIDGGFKTEPDLTASGGSCIVSTGAPDGAASYSFQAPSPGEYILWVRHRAYHSAGNISYAALDGGAKTALFCVPSPNWRWTRHALGAVKEGERTLRLIPDRQGHSIDRLVVTDDAGYNPHTDTGQGADGALAAADEPIQYLPGRDDFAKLPIYEAQERVPGSFFIEAEAGTLVSPMEVVKDRTASEGAYIAAPGTSPMIVNASDSTKIHARYKLNITQRGRYRIWVRYFTPDARYKSTWFAFDNGEYFRLDTTVTDKWTWYVSKDKGSASNLESKYLDVGVHTLDVRYRQGGHMLDCFIVTRDEGFNPVGFGSLPGEAMRAVTPDRMMPRELEDYLYEKNRIKVFVNGRSYKMDVDPVRAGKEILVPAANIINIMGIQLEEHDGYYIAKRGRDYLKFSLGSDTVVISGRQVKTGAKAVLHEDAIPMLPVRAIAEAFGADWSLDEATLGLNITYSLSESFRDANEGEVACVTGESFVNFEIPYHNPAAKVEAWIKISDSSAPNYQGFVYAPETGRSGWNPGYKGSRDNGMLMYWKKAYPLRYENGAFHGSFANLWALRLYDIKVRILDGEKEDIFIAREAVKTQPRAPKPVAPQDAAYQTGGELLLVPTFENMSYYIDEPAPGSACVITYRARGEQAWKKAYQPYYDKELGQFRGSIVGLKADTDYEVSAKIASGSAVKTVSAHMRTWSDDPPVARTFRVRDLYAGSGTLNLDGMQGTADGWIRITGEGEEVIDAGRNYAEAVSMIGSKYIILENVTIKGGYNYGIHIAGGSENVRIINCDISGWSRANVLDPRVGLYVADMNVNNLQGAVKVDRVSNVVIERCYIHDPKGQTNAWEGPTWRNVHPAGNQAIVYDAVRGLVVRYNDFIGSDAHRWNDVMECVVNGDRTSGPGRDADLYGNMMIYAQDDIFEIDSSGMNLRVYQNRMEQALCGISTAPVMSGPTYVFRNLITNLGSLSNIASTVIKGGNSPDSINGVTYFFHNTFDVYARGIVNVNYNGPDYHGVTRNNIVVSRTGAAAVSNTTTDERDSNDYDLIYGTYVVKPGDGKNTIFGLPAYTGLLEGNFTLEKNSPGIDKGERLDNFNDTQTVGAAPDMGAFEHGGDLRFLPYRPVDMWADRYMVSMTSGEEKTVKIHIGAVPAGTRYRLVKPEAMQWMQVSDQDGKTEGEITPGSTLTLTVKADLNGIPFVEGNGMVLFRLDSGYSIPITVFCGR